MVAFIGPLGAYAYSAWEMAFLDFLFLFPYNTIDLLWITMQIQVGNCKWLQKSKLNNTEIPVSPC